MTKPPGVKDWSLAINGELRYRGVQQPLSVHHGPRQRSIEPIIYREQALAPDIAVASS